MSDRPFWEAKTLREMTRAELEGLCDGCGRCCLVRFEDEETGEVTATRIAGRLRDTETGACTNYARRWRYVPDLQDLTWMPRAGAYRRLHEGRGLADWHPLVSGDPDSVRRAGISVAGKVISETTREDVEDALDFPAHDLMEEPEG